MQTKQFLLNGLITSYITSDNFNPNKCLLFLHGWQQNKLSFKKIYDFLDEKDMSYISFDFPGFGSTSFPESDWTIFDYANFTKDFITKTKLIKPTLVGHSFGGRVCIIIGSDENYNNLDKIIIIGGAGIKQKQDKINLFVVKTGKIIFSIPGLRGFGKKIKNKVGSSDYVNSGNMKNIFLNAINQDLSPYLKNIKYKTLLLWGEKDTMAPLKEGLIMSKEIKDSKIKVFKDKTHFVHQEIPKEIFEEIYKFIS